MRKLIKNISVLAILGCIVLPVCACGIRIKLPSAQNGQSIQSGQEATEQTPDGYDAAKALLDTKEYALAVESFTTLIASNPDSASCYIGRGDAYCGLYKGDEALADYKEALNISKTVAAYLGAIDACIIKNDFDSALEYARTGASSVNNETLNDKLTALEEGNIKDSAGREYKITSYDGKGKVVWIHVYEYDENGYQIRAISYNGAGNVTADYECTNTENGDELLSVWHFWDEGIFMRREIKYNEAGKVCEITNHGNDHVATNRTLNFYDESGRKVKSQYWQDVMREYYTISTYKWTDFDKLSEILIVDPNGNQTAHDIYHYDDKQQNIRIDCRDENDELEFYYIFEFNEEGKKTRELRYDGDDTLVQEKVL